MANVSSMSQAQRDAAKARARAARLAAGQEAAAAGIRLRGDDGEEQRKVETRMMETEGPASVMSEDRIKDALKKIRAHTNELRRQGSTPRNLFEGNVEGWDAPKQIKEAIVINWFSDLILGGKYALGGFDRKIWNPVTKREREEWGLVFNSRAYTKEGQPTYGVDMKAFWTTRELYNEQKAVWRNMFRPYDDSERGDLQERLAPGTEVIGGVHETSADAIPTAEELDGLGGEENQARMEEEIEELRTGQR